MNIRTGPKSGPVLLFLHGLGRFSEDYLTFATELAPHFQSVIVDFRGHSDSEWLEGKYFVGDYVNDTVELIRSRFAEPILLYGHSLGAMVALAAAGIIAEHVRGIILEDPPFHTMGRRIQQTPWVALFTGMQQVCRGGGISRARWLTRSVNPAFARGQARFSPACGRLRFAPDALAFGAKCLSKINQTVLAHHPGLLAG